MSAGLSKLVLPSRDEIVTERARRHLIDFIQPAWSVVEPDAPFVGGWHIEAVCEHLEAVARGQIRNLLINMPPRHMKSLASDVFFPAWAWINFPGVKWMYSSYAMQLAVRDSIKCRNLIKSPWYRERWGHLYNIQADQDGRAFYVNNKGGYRLSVSVDSAVTGEGGDIIVCDDPHNALEAATSAAVRERAVLWWKESMSTRLNNPRTGRKIVIMQRLHEKDLSGVLLEEGDYVHLCLPAEYESARKCTTSLGWTDPRTIEGQPLWDPPYGRRELDGLKKTMGSQAAAGQLQQRPAPAEGGMLKRHWWQRYEPKDVPTKFDEIIQTWDLTFGGGHKADYVVGFVIGRVGKDLYGLSRFREQIDFPQQLAAIRSVSASNPDARRKLVENTANAKAAIATLHKEIPGLIAVQPRGGKEERANAWAPYLESGHCHLPKGVQWADELIEESAMFPNGSYDDQVDAWGQGANELFQKAGPIVVDMQLDEGTRFSPWVDV